MAVLATVLDLKNLGFQLFFFGFSPGVLLSFIRIGSFTMYYRMFSVVTS